MRKVFARFFRDETGASAMEYGILAAGIALVITSSLSTLGCQLNTVLYRVALSLR